MWSLYSGLLFNALKRWPWSTEHSSSAHNRYPSINVISCVVEKNGKIKIVSSFSKIKLCFVINVLNNKTIIPLNLAEYPLKVSGDMPRDFAATSVTCFPETNFYKALNVHEEFETQLGPYLSMGPTS